MSKTYLLKTLLIVFGLLFFFHTSPAQAERVCSWRSVPTSTGMAGVPASTPECDTAAGEIKSMNRTADCTSPEPVVYGSRQVCCCKETIQPYVPAKFILPDLQIKIPGLTLTPTDQIVTEKNDDGSYGVSIPWIAEYIEAIYNYGLGIVGILAALVLMGGGVLWLISGGDVSKITQAKEMIIGSIVGMMIMASSYIILYQINPELTRLKNVELGGFAREAFTPDIDSATPLSLDMNGISSVLGVTCGKSSIAEIINQAKGKVTYNNPNRGKTGPDNTVYNDCSGFAAFVLKCARDKNTDTYTGDIFKDQAIWDQDLNKMQPGDFVGWAPKNNKSGSGHVLIYMGNGIFGDCHGGESGRKSGNCIGNNISYARIIKYATTHSDGNLYIKRY